jgi:HEAT repeat protein
MNDRGYVRGRIVKCAVGGMLVLGVLTLAEIAFTQEQAPAILREMLEAKDRKVQNKAIKTILDDRLRTVNMLIEIVDQANNGVSPKQAGQAAAYLLGKLRAPEAVAVLSRALARSDPNDFISVEPNPLTNGVFNALVEIGRPAVPPMITNITTSDDERLRNRSMDVVYRVLGGKDNVIGLLNRLSEQKERSKEEKDRLAKSIAWAQSHYVEPEKPLF